MWVIINWYYLIFFRNTWIIGYDLVYAQFM